MDSTSTRERALSAALELFGRKGYDGVSMNDIADAVGIKAPSLYKHFTGKQALFDALLPAAGEHYRKLWAEVGAAQGQLERDVQALGSLSAERLEQETLAWVKSELTAGKSLRSFVNQCGQGGKWLWDTPVALYQGFFEQLVAAEVLRRGGDPHVMAVEYLSPILHLISLADREEERAGAVAEEARRHIRQFHRVFAAKERAAASGGVRGLFRR